MGIDYDAKLIFGAVIPEFGIEIMKNIKDFDDKFGWDEDDYLHYTEKINSWLESNYPNWEFIGLGRYYDCCPSDQTYVLTYNISQKMGITKLKSLIENTKIEEFKSIYEIMTKDKDVLPSMQAIPNIW